MKKSIFDEQTSKALKNWRKAAVKKNRGGGVGSNSPKQTVDNNAFSSSPTSSPSSLNRFKTIDHSPRSKRYEGAGFPDVEPEPMSPESSSSATHLINVRDHHHHMNNNIASNNPAHKDNTKNQDDFSFDKPAPLL